jgi:hypothetical protein
VQGQQPACAAAAAERLVLLQRQPAGKQQQQPEATAAARPDAQQHSIYEHSEAESVCAFVTAYTCTETSGSQEVSRTPQNPVLRERVNPKPWSVVSCPCQVESSFVLLGTAESVDRTCTLYWLISD